MLGTSSSQADEPRELNEVLLPRKSGQQQAFSLASPIELGRGGREGTAPTFLTLSHTCQGNHFWLTLPARALQ